MKYVITFFFIFGVIGLLIGYGAGESLRSCAVGLAIGMIAGLIIGGVVWDESNKKR